MRAERGSWIKAVLTVFTWIGLFRQVAAQEVNLAGMQVWNVGYWETVSIGDFIGPNYQIRKLKPISLAGCRNGHFSGYVVVTCSTAPITGLKASITDLVTKNGEKIPASCVRIRYPELARRETSWLPPYRFDRFFDEPPAEVPVTDLKSFGNWRPKNSGPVSMQPVWVTVYVPSNAAPGLYEGRLKIESSLNKVPDVPVRIKVAEWTLPDPKNFRVTNFGQPSPESLAQHYDVPRWSDKHFELIAKSLSLMAELNSRQAIIDLCIDFYGLGGVPETMVRWIPQPDGSYKYDFTVLDKYLDTVARAIGKPTLLRVNCWMEWDLKSAGAATTNTGWSGSCQVSTLNPATGEIGRLDQPPADSPEFVAFWKPVLMEVRKKIEARGWFDVTAMGVNSYCWGISPKLVDAYYQIWPDGVWSYTAHNGSLGMKVRSSDKSVSMLCKYSDVIWGLGKLVPRGYQALLKPRPGYWCYTFRGWRCDWDLVAQRRIPEEEIIRGHDGVSDFGVDFFPIKHPTRNMWFELGCGRGTGGPKCSTLALLAPGPNGPTTNERFEAIREGIQICEAILFIQKGLDTGRLPPELAARANAVLDERSKRMIDSYVVADKSGRQQFDSTIYIENAEDRENELFAVAAEVAKALGQ